MIMQNGWAICLFKAIDICVIYLIFKLPSEILSYDNSCVFIVFKYNAAIIE